MVVFWNKVVIKHIKKLNALKTLRNYSRYALLTYPLIACVYGLQFLFIQENWKIYIFKNYAMK